MTNPWIVHIKKYQAAHPGMSYCTAMEKARPSYVPVAKKATKPRKAGKPGALKARRPATRTSTRKRKRKSFAAPKYSFFGF
jgi:hypothetical protein